MDVLPASVRWSAWLGLREAVQHLATVNTTAGGPMTGPSRKSAATTTRAMGSMTGMPSVGQVP